MNKDAFCEIAEAEAERDGIRQPTNDRNEPDQEDERGAERVFGIEIHSGLFEDGFSKLVTQDTAGGV